MRKKIIMVLKKPNLLYTKYNWFFFIIIILGWNVTCFHQIHPSSPKWSCFCLCLFTSNHQSSSNSTNPQLNILLMWSVFTALVVVLIAASISVIFSLHFCLIKLDPFNLHADWFWRLTSQFLLEALQGKWERLSSIRIILSYSFYNIT